jgi:precorrin-6B methylase 2
MRKLLREILTIYYLCSSGGFLKETGWLKSVEKRMPVNKNGLALPWFTISFNYFLQERLKNEMSIFEYGSGNSTIYLSTKVAKICSLEHDKSWYEKMKYLLSKNVNYYHKQVDDGYADFINSSKEKYDVIVIDGRERVACAKNTIANLNDDGVIIWDNSLREKYKEGLEFLSNNGFKRIDFRGLNPGGTVLTATSIFYRNNNCFNL